MRRDETAAWAEFDERFRPLLTEAARRHGIPQWERRVCVSEVLEDTGMRLALPDARVPANLAGYLIIALRMQWAQLRRGSMRRACHYADASGADGGYSFSEPVVRSTCSEASIRDSAGPMEDSPSSTAIVRLARLLDATLSEDERLLLAWVGEGVPRRLIAQWTGSKYEATRKRIARLATRLRMKAVEQIPLFSEQERRVLERLLGSASLPVPSRRIPPECNSDE